MKKKLRKNKAQIGIVLMALSIGLISYWELIGRESIAYKEVLVLQNELSAGDVVTEDMFKVNKVDLNSDVENLVMDVNHIIDKEAVSFIPANTPLVYEYFKESDLALERDEYVFKIPNSWIVSYPSSLRRGDVAYLYPLDSNKNKSDLDYGYEEVEEAEALEVRIAFVKDSSNKEVRTVGDERLDATNNISSLEIATDLETFDKINKHVENGKIFVIYYN